MKIAFDAKRFFNNASGLGNYSRDLVRILAGHYPEHHYLLLNRQASERGKDLLERSNVAFKKTTGRTFPRQLQMGMAAQEAGADIFHGLSGELPLRWHRKKPIKKIVTIHDLIFLRYPEYYSFFDRYIHFWKFKKACEAADIIIAISEQTKNDIIYFLKIPERKIRVVYQGCHNAFKEQCSAETLNAIAQKYALPARFILSVGTVEPRKNLLSILQAVQGSDIPVVVIGRKQKSYWKKLQKFISNKKLEKQVILPENVGMEDLAAIYQMADMLVYPSFFEGFGIPVIEALFSGTPVITSNVSSLPEAGGGAALYVDPRNAADLRAKITFLWDHEGERIRRADAGLQHAQQFSDTVIARALKDVYEEVLII